jgi:hypothetical protein
MGGEVEGAIGGSKHSSLERWEWAELSASQFKRDFWGIVS